MNSLVGFLRASRIPNLLIIGFAQVSTVVFILQKPPVDIGLFLVIASTLMIAAAGYLINDYYDQKIDMVNRPDKVIIGVVLKRRKALLLHSFLNFVAVAIGFYVDVFVGLVHIISSTSLWLYSNHLRRLPLIGNLAIGALTGMTLLILPLYYRETSNIVLIYAFFAFIMVFLREVLKDIEDVKGEAAFGCTTVPVVWGIRGAKIVIYIVVLAGAALLMGFLMTQMNWILRFYFVALTPFFIWFTYSVYKADTHLDFERLKKFCSYIILTGIISILLNQ